jgi:hypothetical protein
MNGMIAAFSIASFAGGSAVSCLSTRLPISQARGEFVGGVLLIVGLVLVGVGLGPIFR